VYGLDMANHADGLLTNSLRNPGCSTNPRTAIRDGLSLVVIHYATHLQVPPILGGRPRG
jgi:hypothetical protein